MKNYIRKTQVGDQPDEYFEDIMLEEGEVPIEVHELPWEPVYDDDDEEKENTEYFLLDKSMFIDFKKIKKISLNDPILKTLEFGDIQEYFKMDSSEALIYSDSTWDFIRYKYTQIYNIFPDVVRIEGLKSKKFIAKIFQLYDIKNNYYHKTISKNPKDKILLLNFTLRIDDLILFFDGGDSVALFYNKKYEKQFDSKFYLLLGLMKNFKEPIVSKNKIYVVYRNDQGFTKMGFTVKKVNVDLSENYNDDFKPISTSIIKDLNNKEKTGLFILSGEPGTGKCVIGKTKITIRNKKTKKIEDIYIEDLL